MLLNMKKRLLMIFIIIAAIVGVAIYAKAQMFIPLHNNANDDGATSEGINAVIKANNQFALDLYSELSASDGNVFFSPYSISAALAMTYEGARGKTADEIQSVFHFPADGNLRKPAFASIHNQLNKPNSKYELSVANALWAQKDYKFLESYLTTIKQFYDGNATNLDFINSTEESRETINRWVEDKTNNKIKELFPEDSLNEATRLVLTNAIYFNGTWKKQFEKDQTENEDFKVSSTKKISVPMMSQTDEDSKFNYAETNELQMLEMPYEGKKLSMLVLLTKNNNLRMLESSLSLNKINGWKNKLKKQRVFVNIPKFTFDKKYSMQKTLAKMGMPTIFTSGADLSGMDGTKDLFVEDVIHKSFIDVNEEGTEAAAATGVAKTLGMPRSVTTFHADHPFIFLIQDKKSGNILFLGRVMNPSK